MLPIKNLRALRYHFAQRLIRKEEELEADPTEKAYKAYQAAYKQWQDASDTYAKTRRRAEWERARRIITLAAHGRGQKEAHAFMKQNFNYGHK